MMLLDAPRGARHAALTHRTTTANTTDGTNTAADDRLVLVLEQTRPGAGRAASSVGG